MIIFRLQTEQRITFWTVSIEAKNFDSLTFTLHAFNSTGRAMTATKTKFVSAYDSIHSFTQKNLHRPDCHPSKDVMLIIGFSTQGFPFALLSFFEIFWCALLAPERWPCSVKNVKLLQGKGGSFFALEERSPFFGIKRRRNQTGMSFYRTRVRSLVMLVTHSLPN